MLAFCLILVRIQFCLDLPSLITLIARAVTSVPNGWIVIDGQKTDGVDSLLKQVKANVPSVQSYSKAHGKTIWFAASNGAALTDWLQDPIRLESGWWTAPGVFSADSVDPASQMLVDALPKLQGSGADLGAGWGYLSAVALAQNPEITKLALVEDNRVALECAGRNVDDPRAVFHWHDALSWTPVQRLDWVIMNPPFHTGRKAAPDLGRAFILRAAEVLTPGGVLYMVANAHLPYDAALADSFKTAEIIAKTTRYKAWRAQARRSVLRSR